MRPYPNQELSLQDQDMQENPQYYDSHHQKQPHLQKNLSFQNLIQNFRNCTQKKFLIAIFAIIICWFFFIFISSIFYSTPTIDDSFFTTTNTLAILKNTLLSDKNIPQEKIPIMKVAKTHNISQTQIENAIKYCQIIPTYKNRNPEKMSIFEQLSKSDFSYFNKTYELKKYQEKQISFCIILPNLTKTQNPQNINFVKSILRQNYSNYKLVWSSSNSTTWDMKFEAFLKDYDFDMAKSFKIQNSKKILENIYFGIKKYCSLGEVVILINNIDFLIGRNILSLFNSVYQEKKPMVMYSEFLKIDYYQFAASLGNFSVIEKTQENQKSFKNLDFEGQFPFISFYANTFLSIPLDYLLDENENFYTDLWENALFEPLFSLSGSHFYYLNEITFAINAQFIQPKIPKNEIHYMKIYDQIQKKKQLQRLTITDLTFVFNQISENIESNPLPPNADQTAIDLKPKDEQPPSAESEKNLLKDEQNDLTISEDQQQKITEVKPVKLQEKSPQNLPQKEIQKPTEKQQNQKQKRQTQIDEQPRKIQMTKPKFNSNIKVPKLNDEEDLKQPLLENTYEDERNPLESPTIVKPQIQIQNSHIGDESKDLKQADPTEHRPQNFDIQTKPQQQVMIDGKISVKSTEVLPVDQIGGFFEIDEEEESEQQILVPKVDKKQQLKKIPMIGVGKMQVKGPNYTFNVSIEDMINNVDLQKIFGKKKSKEGIWKNQFLQAIEKLEITNNIKYGGEIQVQMTKFDNDKFEKTKRIQDLIKTDTDYLDSNYKINEFKKKQLPFCIVVPSYQNVNSGLYLRNLNSIFMQNYTNYHIVYIDDASSDKTGEYVKSYVFSRNIPLQKIEIITNKENRKPPYNIYNAITNHCKLGELALIVQGDDALLGTNVLSLYNAIYQRDKCAMIYSSYLDIFQNSRVQLGVAHQIMDEYFQKNSIRTISEIPGKYLLSFYVDIFKSIQVQQFKDPKGYFFWFAYDRALITPLLEVSYPRISIVKEILYEHRRDTDKTESPNDWNRESKQILAKKPYKPLKFFPFIERNKYKYFIDVPIDKVIENSDFDAYTFLNNFEVEGITKDMHIRSIKLLQLVHNIRYGGQIVIQLAEYESSKEEKTKRLEKLLEQDKKYYNEKYDIEFYRKEELPFCIVTPSYNNVKSGLYLRNLDSIFMQDYKNYHVVYIDDCSPDKTGEYVKKYLEERKIPQRHIEVIINKENKKAMYNLHMGIHKYCKSGQIVTIIDGDDSFLGRNVLGLFNAVYQKEKAAMAYSNFLTIHNNDRTEIGFCHDIDKQMFEQNTFRNSWDLPGTHLMTFYSDLFKKIKISDLTYPNGTFYDYAYDRAILTPLLEMAYPRISVIKQITYEYRNDTGINDAPDDWSRVSHIILDKKPYAHLQEYPFIKGLIESTDKFNIKAEIETVIKNTNLTVYDKEPNKKITGIAKEQHIHAIRLTELVHNVKFDGRVNVSLKNTKNAEKKKQRLEKLLKNDKEYLETKYDISKYKQNQLPFCIVVSSHSSVQNGLYLRNLNSIFMQDYKNYRIIYIDDNSPEESEEYIKKYLEEEEIPSHVIKIIRAEDTKRQLSNIYFSAHNECELTEIMLVIGESDALIGRNVLNVLNTRYQKDESKVGFSCFLKVFNSSTQLGTCADINPYYFKGNTFRNHLQYEQYRLMSFYTYIFRQIRIKDLTYENGTFYSNAIDKAIMTPLIEMVYPDVLVIKDIMYEDRLEEDSKDPVKEAAETNLILSKEPYAKIDTSKETLIT